jgi:hypothetical protein
MYGRKEISLTRTKFWTTFGQYMRPVPGAAVERINWLNYKTGIKGVYFRMTFGNSNATISLELHQDDDTRRAYYFEELLRYKSLLNDNHPDHWIWEKYKVNEYGRPVSWIYQKLDQVNIFNEEDWPKVISFLKLRLIILDKFWQEVKDHLEQ